MTAHSVTCASCNAEVRGELYHLGFSDMACMYCDSCPRVLLLKDPNLMKRHGIKWPNLKAGDAGWEEYDRHLLPIYERIQAIFRPCACGGTYKANAAPRCPKCNDFVLGRGVADADKPSTWQKGHVFVTLGSVTDAEQEKQHAA